MVKTAPEDMKTVLELRQETAKSSIKKFQTMERAACSDDRVRGMFQFFGAPRTGRFAGRLVQLQNLKRNDMPDLAEARALVKEGNYEALELLYDSVPEVLSELIRTALVPKPGYKFYVADYSAVEARCLSFLAKEQWRIDSFAANKDIYCESASQMFHCNVVKHGENGHLRQRGKIAELALGYGGSVGALKAMGALEQGLDESELQPLVDAWRATNPKIVAFWWEVDEAIKKAVRFKTTTETHGLKFICQSGMLFIQLPSGRSLSYVKPRIGVNQYGSDCVTYMGLDSTKHWSRVESYGPKFVENITQAICRDILCYAMQTLQFCFICAHVHDELIIECKEEVSLDEICKLMGRTPPWIPGLLLRADGYTCDFYQKD
jgi:DNA polymerase